MKQERESDEARFYDLLAEHDIQCRKIRSRYRFDDFDFTAYGFNQAYGFVEGVDRERSQISKRELSRRERPEEAGGLKELGELK
jgi:hypothetical protein